MDFKTTYRAEGSTLYRGWEVIAAFTSKEECKKAADALNAAAAKGAK